MLAANIHLLQRINYKSVFIFSLYALVWSYTLTEYLSLSAVSFLLGLLALPFTFSEPGEKVSYRNGVVSFLFIITCFLVPVKTNLFFAIGFALLFMIESFYARTGFLSAVTLFLIAPVFQYAINVFSFPIRLQITHWAGKLFSLIMEDVNTKGNVIYHHGNEFSVDPGCMGLNMLVASLLISIMLVGFWMKKTKKTIRWFWLLLYFIGVLFFNVLSNLFRILILVQFSILPGTVMHDVVGVATLLLYVVFPTFYLARYFVNKMGRLISGASVKGDYKSSKYGAHFLLIVLVVFSACRVRSTDTYKKFALSSKQINKYQASEFVPGIIKLESASSLIYVKYVRGFYDTDHNPTICWKGSGFEFQQIEQTAVNGYSIFTALLVNGKEQLYTAWWYGNGTDNTTDQLTWRWDMANGSKAYAVINVTASKKENLFREVGEILQKRSLAVLFK